MLPACVPATRPMTVSGVWRAACERGWPQRVGSRTRDHHEESPTPPPAPTSSAALHRRSVTPPTLNPSAVRLLRSHCGACHPRPPRRACAGEHPLTGEPRCRAGVPRRPYPPAPAARGAWRGGISPPPGCLSPAPPPPRTGQGQVKWHLCSATAQRVLLYMRKSCTMMDATATHPQRARVAVDSLTPPAGPAWRGELLPSRWCRGGTGTAGARRRNVVVPPARCTYGVSTACRRPAAGGGGRGHYRGPLEGGGGVHERWLRHAHARATVNDGMTGRVPPLPPLPFPRFSACVSGQGERWSPRGAARP